MNPKFALPMVRVNPKKLLGKIIAIAWLGSVIGCSPAAQNSTEVPSPSTQNSPVPTTSVSTSTQPQASPSPLTIPDEKFNAQLNNVKDTVLKDQYLAALKAFADIPKERPEYQAIVAKMLHHQDRVFEMLSDCESEDPAVIQRSEFYKISDQQFIFQRVCFLAAYNVSYAFFLYTETPTDAQVKPLKITTYRQDENTKEISKEDSHLFAGLAKYDEKNQELSLISKYRGIGDCGISGKYQFQNNELVLQEFLADFECDGKIEFNKVYPQ
ncbi:MAG: DUF1176 domain-containing protein [Scytolyngbya sp. HA4215-MV1]|jgi:LAS superfamily LD-carboxypeptidase LdcB|nr:DUF1176 domain-containing protein [Scytolyngbya sp. HA4215-MV1]